MVATVGGCSRHFAGEAKHRGSGVGFLLSRARLRHGLPTPDPRVSTAVRGENGERLVPRYGRRESTVNFVLWVTRFETSLSQIQVCLFLISRYPIPHKFTDRNTFLPVKDVDTAYAAANSSSTSKIKYDPNWMSTIAKLASASSSCKHGDAMISHAAPVAEALRATLQQMLPGLADVPAECALSFSTVAVTGACRAGGGVGR